MFYKETISTIPVSQLRCIKSSSNIFWLNLFFSNSIIINWTKQKTCYVTCQISEKFNFTNGWYYIWNCPNRMNRFIGSHYFPAKSEKLTKLQVILTIFFIIFVSRAKTKNDCPNHGRGSERRRSERRQAKNFRTSKWSF